LKNITSTFDSARTEALNANVIPPLVRLLSFNDPRVQKSAALALKNITLHGPARTAALSSDAIPSLVHLLTSDDINVQASAVAVLESLTIRGGGEVAVGANAIPALVGLLLSNDIHVFTAACGTLKNMMTLRCARVGIKAIKSHLSNLFFSTVDTQSHHRKTF
jgi:HEAT repeat protein